MHARKPDARAALIKDLRFLLVSSNRALERAFAGTPLLRAGGLGLKRNALIVAGNLRATELKTEIAQYQSHEKLGELALWALGKLSQDS